MYNKNLDQLTDYPFARLKALLEDIEPPKDITPLIMSIGEPQMQPPAFLQSVINQSQHLWNKYPPMAGTSELKQAIGQFLDYRYKVSDMDWDAEQQSLAVNGTREALFMLAMLCLNHDDKPKKQPIILMPNPFYQVYYGAALMNGAKAYLAPATRQNGFQPDYGELSEDILKQTQMAYICSPSNPQGAFMSLGKMVKQLELARHYNYTLVVDECYSEIYREGEKPIGGIDAAKILGRSLDNLLIVNSLSKRSSAAGLRSGFVAGDKQLISMLLRLRNYGGAVLGGPIQAASAALWRDQAHVENMRKAYNKKFAIAAHMLKDWPEFETPKGGFFLWLKVKNGEQAARYLWQHHGLKVLPGQYLSYGDVHKNENPGQNYIRIAIVHDDEQIYEGLTRLCYAMDFIV